MSTLLLGAFLVSLAKAGVEKAVEKISEKSVDGITKWIKSIFYKNDKPGKILEDIRKNPSDKNYQLQAEGLIRNSIEDNPLYQSYLDEIRKAYPENTGEINTGNTGSNYGIAVGKQTVNNGNIINR